MRVMSGRRRVDTWVAAPRGTRILLVMSVEGLWRLNICKAASILLIV